PAVGPPISGVLINHFAWRSLFLVTLPIALAILLFIFLYMRNVTEQRETNVDVLSIILSTIGFGGILYGFTMLQTSDVISESTIISIALGVVAIGWFSVRQLRLKIPILELRVFIVQIFILVNVITCLSFNFIIATESRLPMYVHGFQVLSTVHAGLVVAHC